MQRKTPNYVHPKDREALNAMKAIPLFPQALKAFMNFFDEQLFHGLNMAQKIRLSEKQLPEIYNLLPPICEKLGIDEPEFYLEMNPMPNAYTFGDTRVYITVTSGLIECMEEDELKAVIAHECGHIACGHVLYHTMAKYILEFGTSFLGALSAVAIPLQLAIFAWSRMSEFSADRAASIVMGGPKSVVETMIRLAGGPKSVTESVDIDEYIKQAESYVDMRTNNFKDKVLQLYIRLQNSHPFNAVRAREILAWCNTEQYKNINTEKLNSGTKCNNCRSEISADWKFCRSCGVKL